MWSGPTQDPAVGMGSSWVDHSRPLGSPTSSEGTELAPLCPFQQISSPSPVARGGIISPEYRVQLSHESLEGQSQLSCCSVQQKAGSVFPGPVKVGASSRWTSDFTMHGSYDSLRWHRPHHRHQRRSQPQLDHGPRHGPLSSSLALDDILALGGSTATQVGIVREVAWFLDTTKASGCGSNLMVLNDLW